MLSAIFAMFFACFGWSDFRWCFVDIILVFLDIFLHCFEHDKKHGFLIVAIIREYQQWVHSSRSLFNTLLLVFPRMSSVRTATRFVDATCPNLKLTSIHTFCKGLSYLCICELRKPKLKVVGRYLHTSQQLH